MEIWALHILKFFPKLPVSRMPIQANLPYQNIIRKQTLYPMDTGKQGQYHKSEQHAEHPKNDTLNIYAMGK